MNLPSQAAPLPNREGPVSRVLIRLIMKQATVEEVETVTDHFRLVTLTSPDFRETSWEPGQKLQIAMGSAFITRTFTPIEWDAKIGRTRVLGYLHGHGPASAWLSSITPGDPCNVFGPRTSTRLNRATGSVVVLGDETSIGLVHALTRSMPTAQVRCLLEVTGLQEAKDVFQRLGHDGFELFQCMHDELHHIDMEQRAAQLAGSGAVFLLTGRAPMIQRLRRHLHACGVAKQRLIAKPYWAPGKTGLD